MQKVKCPGCSNVYNPRPERWVTCVPCRTTFRIGPDGRVKSFANSFLPGVPKRPAGELPVEAV